MCDGQIVYVPFHVFDPSVLLGRPGALCEVGMGSSEIGAFKLGSEPCCSIRERHQRGPGNDVLNCSGTDN